MAAFFPSVDASWIRTRNGGKRRAQAVTFGSDPLANVFVTLDSDTVLDPAAIEEGIKPFADRRVSSVAGVLLTLNASHNLFTRLTDTWLTAFQMSHLPRRRRYGVKVSRRRRPFQDGLGAERAGLAARCNESPAIMRAKPGAGKDFTNKVGLVKTGLRAHQFRWPGLLPRGCHPECPARLPL